MMFQKIVLVKTAHIGASAGIPVGTHIVGDIENPPSEGTKLILKISLDGELFTTSEVEAVTEDTIITKTAAYEYYFASSPSKEITFGEFKKINTFFDSLKVDTSKRSLGEYLGGHKLSATNLSQKMASAIYKSEDVLESIARILPTLEPIEVALLVGGMMIQSNQKRKK